MPVIMRIEVHLPKSRKHRGESPVMHISKGATKRLCGESALTIAEPKSAMLAGKDSPLLLLLSCFFTLWLGRKQQPVQWEKVGSRELKSITLISPEAGGH